MNKVTIKALALLSLCALSPQPASAGIGNYIACAGLACLGLGLSIGWDAYQATKPTAQSEDNLIEKTELKQLVSDALKTPEGQIAVLKGLQKGIKNISFFRYPITRIRLEALVSGGMFWHNNQAMLRRFNQQRLQPITRMVQKVLRKI